MANEGDYLWEIRVDIDPEREEEWNRWYNEVHVPEVLACPGVHRARRFVAVNGSPKYKALYDIDDEKVLESPAVMAIRGWKQFQPHVKNPQSSVYKKFKDFKKD